MRNSTPWGPAQHTTIIAEGIVNYSTAGHGGIGLDAKHWREFQRKFPNFQPFTAAAWFEEDQDWAAVALAFPEHFSAQDLRAAIRTAKSGIEINDRGWSDICNWVESLSGAEIRQRIGKWISENAANWERGSSGSPPAPYKYPHSWSEYIRVGDGARQSIIEDRHDWKSIYTDEDLASFRVATLREVAA